MNGETFEPATKSPLRSSFVQHTLTVIAANVFGGGIFLIASILLVRLFSVEDFGRYKNITSFFIFLFSVADLGVNFTLVKYVAQFKAENTPDKINHLLRSLVKIKLFSTAFFLFVIIIGARQLSTVLLHTPSYQNLVIAGATILVFSIFETLKAITLGFQRYREFSLSTLFTFLFSGAFTLLGAYIAGLGGAIVGFGIGYFVGNLPAIIFAVQYKIFTKKSTTFHVRPIFTGYSLPIFLTVIMNSLGSAYIPLLSPFFSQTIIGYYGFSLTFYSGIYLFAQSFFQLMLTRSASIQNEEHTAARVHLLQRTFFLYTVISFIGIAGIVFLAQPVILIINPDYLSGITIFRWFLSASFAFGALVVLSGYWSGLGKVKRALTSLIAYNVILFAVSYVLLAVSR